ncbi:UDP-N-acetylmuramate--L-alanine ligase [Crocinitomicaceae bacterium]|nr:UDP-N-acetylmuramate--L-alanine ligase [Crocinitomicaceae bacterium]
MNKRIIDYKNFFFVGIGGIGMSALARYFNSFGKKVAGYDKNSSLLTHTLNDEGCQVAYEDHLDKIPKTHLSIEDTLVVYTPAIPKEHRQLQYFQEKNFQVLKRSEVLGLITRFNKALCVAGTHGKTTTSAMLAHVLSLTDYGCSAFLGGISSNFNSNVLVNKQSEWTVVEADEFDRSFLHLSPFISIITATDPDHLDVYGDPDHFNEGFQQYAMKIDPNGWCIAKEGIKLHSLSDYCTYNIESKSADYSANDISYEAGFMCFYVQSKEYNGRKFELGIPGIHNVLNAMACIVLLEKIGISYPQIRKGLASFRGVRRRFDIHINSDDLMFIDDYAHHPEELRLLVDSLKMMYPGKKLIAIFQPHLFSRTRDFGLEFGEQLSRFDELYLMPIYAARENEIIGISSEWLLSKVSIKDKRVVESTKVLEIMKDIKEGVVLTIGAGDIDRLVSPLQEILSQNIKHTI